MSEIAEGVYYTGSMRELHQEVIRLQAALVERTKMIEEAYREGHNRASSLCGPLEIQSASQGWEFSESRKLLMEEK